MVRVCVVVFLVFVIGACGTTPPPVPTAPEDDVTLKREVERALDYAEAERRKDRVFEQDVEYHFRASTAHPLGWVLRSLTPSEEVLGERLLRSKCARSHLVLVYREAYKWRVTYQPDCKERVLYDLLVE